MITKISIKNAATFGQSPEVLNGLKKINFIYGSNATGKTTISRLIAKAGGYQDRIDYRDCDIAWQDGTELKTLVYNRDFIDKNFTQREELEGIFTLGEEEQQIRANIDRAKEELKEIDQEIVDLRKTLGGEPGNGGKYEELQKCESAFTEKCWKLKTKHDEPFKEAFRRYRGDRERFKEKLIKESDSNSGDLGPLDTLDSLKERAKTVFAETHQKEDPLGLLNFETLLGNETNAILEKRVIGRSDVDIAEMIEKLANSDWVKQGRDFYAQSKPSCPFCQQKTNASLEKSLNEYFDDTFLADFKAIDELYKNYNSGTERLKKDIETLLEHPTRYLSKEHLKTVSDRLDAQIARNLRHIEDKKREPSKKIQLESTQTHLNDINALLEHADTKIRNHNMEIENLEEEQAKLTAQVWRYLLDYEIKDDLADYKRKKTGIEQTIDEREQQIRDATERKQKKEREIGELENKTTSIKPTIANINRILNGFGFQNFSLAESDCGRFYEVQRPDRSNAKTTLSEGEQSFVAFLYFYHLLKGSTSENDTTTSDRIVVFDDPVSSLDSNILFIVSTLIKELFDDVIKDNRSIKQIFVLTHNVYFHHLVSFRQHGPHTFWIVRKNNNISKVRKYNTNPIKNEYELLWGEVRELCDNEHNDDPDTLGIQNALRRILEHYFKILGGMDKLYEVCDCFDGEEKLICQSLLYWADEGSHTVSDSLYVSPDHSEVSAYLSVFKRIFEETDHIAHYNMMMGKAKTASQHKLS